MKCKICGGDEHRVIRTEAQDGEIGRRRQCVTCGYRWSTVEIPSQDWKHRKSVVRLASALAQAIADPRQIYQDESGTRVTIIVDADGPGGGKASGE